MSVNISGGGLEFDASLGTDDFHTGLDSIVNGVEKTIKTFEGLNTSGGSALDELKQKFIALEKQEEQLRLALDHTTDPTLIKQYNEGLANTVAQMTALGKEITAASAVQLTPPADNDAPIQKQIQAYSQLRQLKNQLAVMDHNSPAFGETFEQAEKLENEIKNINKALELSGKNTGGLEALTEGVRGLIGAFEAYNGVLGLTASQDAQVEKTISNVVSAMGILNGIQEIASVLDKRSALNVFLLEQYRKATAATTIEQAAATETLVAAQETEIVATEGATVAQTELNVAMDANPAGILLLALVGIVFALQGFVSGSESANDKQEKLNATLAESNEVLAKMAELQKQFLAEGTQGAQNAVDLAQAQGKSEATILGLKLQAVEAKRHENIYALGSLSLLKSDVGYMEAQLENVLQQQRAVISLKSITGELSKADQKRLDDLNNQEKAIKALLDPAKAYLDAIKGTSAEIANIQAAQAKLAHDSALKSAQGSADAQLELSKKNTQAELDAEIAAIKARQAVELNNANLTAGERAKINADAQKAENDAQRKFKIVQLNDTKDILDAQLQGVKEGSAEELQLRIDIINKSAQIEMAQDGVTAAHKIDIQAKANKQTSDVIKQFAIQNAQTEVEIAIAGTNTKLAAVQKGTEQELALKKDLVDDQAKQDILSAQSRIKNETLLAARILEINATSTEKKKQLDDEYTDRVIQNQLKVIQNGVTQKNAQLQATINDPFSTALSKFNAQKQQIQNTIDGLNQEIGTITSNILLNKGDINKLKADLSDVMAQRAQAQAALQSLVVKFQQSQIQQVAQDITAISTSLGTLSQELATTNPKLAAALGNLSKIGSIAAGVISQAATGNYVGAVTTEITGVISLLAEAAEKTREAQKAIEDYNTSLVTGEIEYQALLRQRQLTQLELNNTTLQGIKDEQAALTAQKGQIQKEMDDLMAQIAKQTFTLDQSLQNNPLFSGILGYTPLGAIANLFGIGGSSSVNSNQASLAGLNFDQLSELFDEGRLNDQAKALFEELQNLKSEGVDIDKELTDLQEKTKEIFTGTTSDDIASGIVDGFKQGKRAIADFADNFQDLMTNAILSALEAQTLQPALQGFYDQFANFSASDGVLTADEIAQLKVIYNGIISTFGQQVENLQQISGLNLSATEGASSGVNSLAGAIKGITADQAELLAGQFGGLRLTAISQLKAATDGLLVLQDIESNTASILDVKAILTRMELNGIKVK